MSANLIELKVKSFIEKDQMFTSVDISNAIKSDGLFVRNVTVAEWLRNNSSDDDLFSDYSVTQIDLDNGRRANLYHPVHLDPNDYKSRDQKSLTPAEVDKIKGKAMTKVFSAVPTKQQAKANKKRNSSMGSNPASTYGGSKAPAKAYNQPQSIQAIQGKSPKITPVSKKHRIRSLDRIKIPGAIIKKLGWKPGDKIKTDKIVAKNAKLPENLTVNADFRVSIPRTCVPWDNSDVNVYLEDNVICFEKA